MRTRKPSAAERAVQTEPASPGLYIRVWLALALTDFRLKFLPYRMNKSFIFAQNSGDSGTNSAEDDETRVAITRRTATIVARAAGHPFIFTMSCLRRSLVLRALLARRGVSSRLVLGAASVPAPGGGSRIAHHAWLEVSGVRIDTYGAPDRYAAYR